MNMNIYQVGTNPELEATRLKTLFSDKGVDDLVVAEFGTTVEAYRQLEVEEIAERIKSKYCGEKPNAFGLIPSVEGLDIGMVVYGHKDYQDPSNKVMVEGVNISGWLLKQYRRKGFAGYLSEVVDVVQQQVNDQEHLLFGRKIWTSIHIDNYPSRSVSEKSGFVQLGPAIDKPSRLIYTVD
jgi:RimJ/RimL family protein N-acetyltransferase